MGREESEERGVEEEAMEGVNSDSGLDYTFVYHSGVLSPKTGRHSTASEQPTAESEKYNAQRTKIPWVFGKD